MKTLRVEYQQQIPKLVFLGQIKMHSDRTSVTFASKECLMILCGQIHVIVRERFLIGGPVKPLIFCAPEKIDRIAPDFTVGHILMA